MEELNIEELKKRKTEIEEELENNAEYIRHISGEIDSFKNGNRRNQLISGIILFFANIGVSITCFTLGESILANVFGWIFAVFAGIDLFVIISELFIPFFLMKKQINIVSDSNMKLEEELKEINSKFIDNTLVKKTRRSRKQKTQEVNE